MPTRSKLPSILLSAAISRSPCSTLMPTWVWLSAAVENTCDFLVGMVVLRLMRRVKTPPMVSMPRLRGVTSSSRMSFTSPRSTPPWMAAPMATTSSGLTEWHSCLPPKNSDRISWTRGMRVEPPTSTISSTASGPSPASARTWETGSIRRWSRSALMSSNSARVMVQEKSRPSKSASTCTVACSVDDSSRLAASAAVRRRRMARGSARTPSASASASNTDARWCTMRSSKSSPPRWVSPAVAFTSSSPDSMESSVTSKVPPPRSNTSTVLSRSLSSSDRRSRPYAMAAAVGSFTMRSTSRPAIAPASLVAWRWLSLK
mmetsp:Transcript_41946/g.108636  ORF Transcript_41946/g.108636 Transcript_41946/m.108636 type:complete len:317 (-) Transcript_41946:776-1726(-)